MESKLFVILGNQLFDPKILKENKCNEVFMAEDYELCTYFKHHKLKLFLFLTAMREYRDELKNKSFSVNYFELQNRKKNENYIDFLIKFLKDKEISEIDIFEIEDKGFENLFLKELVGVGVKVNIIKSPMFLFERSDFVSMAKGKKVYRMSSFYQKARKTLKILMDENDKPIGGKWSFDEENRKKIPKNITPPEMVAFKESKYSAEVKNLINSNFNDHPGNLDKIWFPVDRAGAQKQLDNFLKIRFENFGIYEDAMLENKNFLFHSCISPFLNIGLLTPHKVIDKTLQFAKKNNIPMNSVEGFVRQIIGWREFIRGIYHEEGEVQLNSNYWKHTKKLTQSWYDGTTGIDPLDDCIKTTLKDGYIHHIPRLMVISNIMNLCGIDPREIYKWFMEMYIDSSDWVMVPNVFGMATYADGGMMSTKPYTCGSNYILKMSNYKKGDWCDTLDGLYWKFTEKNRKFYENNPRLSLLVRSLDRLEPSRKKNIFTKAENFIKQNTF
ncbi:MAG: cryptochrome/photolyase family protein [Actinobacteria bacterium]|nr:cryptochrome/photolyase family protein [Actinomycetota bacterium]